MANLPRPSRHLLGLRTAAPVRLVHPGLGNLHRVHQVVPANAFDASEWGIAAFTGRRPDAAEALAPQDGLYTLITRSAEGDTFDVAAPISAIHPASDHQAYLGYLRRPEVAVMTITVSEAGDVRGPDGHPDRSRDVISADIAALQNNIEGPVSSLPGRLIAGLLARRAADAGPISILSCDNLPENGAVTATVVADLAAVVDDTLLAWMEKNVDFATSMVDRITPATTAEDRNLVAQIQGYEDASPVPTEPFAEWMICGRFPVGRPAWEDAGARLVEDITPYEQRKLWLSNASHSLLARSVEAATAQRLACDNRLLGAIIIKYGNVLPWAAQVVWSVTTPGVDDRDTMCRSPGCHQTRHLKAHHVIPWILSGRSELDNSTWVCRGRRR